MSNIKLTLLENAENFIKHSLRQAIDAERDPHYWKYAILNLVQSIELSLKELLRKEHEILMYKNIDNPRETVSLEIAVSRLQSILKIKFNKDDLEKIKLASIYRNKIVHYEFSFNEKEIKSIYAKLIGFLQSTFNSYFKKNLDEIVGEGIWQEAAQIIEYAEELLTRANERFEKEGLDSELIMECRLCHQHAFVFQDDINTCYVCGYKDEIGQCERCEQYFYSDDLRPSHEFDDKGYCDECIQDMINDFRNYYDI